MKLIRSTDDWKERIIAFADEVFGDDVLPGGFSELLPRLYGPEAHTDANHFCVIEDQEILAELMIDPVNLISADHILPGIGVGTVSVGMKARGEGYMKLLLQEVHRYMEDNGIAFAALSGNRQRYGYFGFQPTGVVYRVEIGQDNIKHALKPVYSEISAKISLKVMEKTDPDVERAWDLQLALPYHTQRSREHFAQYLTAWTSTPYLIYREEEFAGYMTASFRRGTPVVEELVLREDLMEEELLGGILLCFSEKYAKKGFFWNIHNWEQQFLPLAEQIYGDLSVKNDDMYYIADMRRTLEFGLIAKQAVLGIQDGSWTVQTEKGIYRMYCDDGICEVSFEKTDVRSNDAECFHTTEAELTRVAFGPTALLKNQPVKAPEGWLPLMFGTTDADRI